MWVERQTHWQEEPHVAGDGEVQFGRFKGVAPVEANVVFDQGRVSPEDPQGQSRLAKTSQGVEYKEKGVPKPFQNPRLKDQIEHTSR